MKKTVASPRTCHPVPLIIDPGKDPHPPLRLFQSATETEGGVLENVGYEGNLDTVSALNLKMLDTQRIQQQLTESTGLIKNNIFSIEHQFNSTDLYSLIVNSKYYINHSNNRNKRSLYLNETTRQPNELELNAVLLKILFI